MGDRRSDSDITHDSTTGTATKMITFRSIVLSERVYTASTNKLSCAAVRWSESKHEQKIGGDAFASGV